MTSPERVAVIGCGLIGTSIAMAAVRSGDAVIGIETDARNAAIAADRAEQTDLAAKFPDRVKDLAAQYDTWAKRVGVRPWPLNQGTAKKKQKQSAYNAFP